MTMELKTLIVMNQIDNLRLKTEELQESILRLNADIENLRKRNLKDIENAARSSIEIVFKEILPVIDSFELGMSNRYKN